MSRLDSIRDSYSIHHTHIMHSLWIFFLNKRAFTYLLMGALSFAGIVSLLAIPKESAPEVIIPVGVVTTTMRGGGSLDMERLVTDKIEQEVQNLENIDTVTSSSMEGVSVVSAQFLASADIDRSIDDLKQAVDRAKAEFPLEADEPRVTKINFADQPMLMLSISADLSPAELAKLGEDVSEEIESVAGVSEVRISGTRDREVTVVLHRAKLLQYGVRIDQVIAALSRSNASLPVGNIIVDDVDYAIQFTGTIENTREVADIAVSSTNGTPVYVRDLATVHDGLKPTQTYSRASVDALPAASAMSLSVMKRAGGDVTAIAEAVRNRLSDLGAPGSMLEDASVVVTFDNGKEVTKNLNELTRAGLETVLLVILMLILTIGWRESMIAALSIPLSFVIAFIGLYASGNTINFISLFSLILAIGILVDSGIVVTEAIHTRTKKYGNPTDAALQSIREYGWPLIAGTMATVVFFVPLFFISGVVGKFISSIPFTLIFVLIASIVVALGMVPLLATRFTSTHKNRLEVLQDEYAEKAKEWYMSMLSRVLKNRKFQNGFIASLVVGLIVSFTFPIVGLVKVQFFPEDDLEFVYVEIERPEGTTLEATDLSVREVEEYLYDYPYVESFVTTVGRASDWSGDGPVSSGSGGNSKLGNITVNLTKERDKTSTEIMHDLRRTLSPIDSAIVRVNQPSGGPPVGAPILIKFTGEDLDDLARAVEVSELALSKVSGVRDIRTSLSNNGNQFGLTIDRTRAATLGLSTLEVAQTLRTAVSGVTATTIKQNGEDIDVVVKVDLNPNFVDPEETRKTTMESIMDIPMTTPQGTVLLGSVLTTDLTEHRAIINREEGDRIMTVTAQINGETTALEVSNAFEDKLKELPIPDGVTVTIGGENEDVNRSFAEMGLALLAGMILAFAILVLEFNSFRYAMYLILTIPLSLFGVLFGLMISGQSLSFSSLLGVIALAGVIINHAIILLDSVIHTIAAHPDRPLHDSIVEASAVRLRPIFLTTVTTVVGMIPLAGVSALWGPLAFTIMFGLSFAMLLTLLLIPILFARWPGSLVKK
jgi:multidrug efflux pump subunit AcrB